MVTVISTFAGTGGSSLGYHLAGFKELLAIDFDKDAVDSFKLNFPDVPIWHKSVTDITGQEILDFCKIKKGELDVFDGSPPCQGFSTSGKRDVGDIRNGLFKDYWRLVTELQPKVFVMENVPGMVKGPMRGRFIEIMNTLKSGNYNVKCKQLNAMFYNVPQSRERLFFIGVRKDLGKEPVYPIPNKNVINVEDAIGNMISNEHYKLTDCYGKLWHKIPPGKSAAYVLNGKGFNNCLKLHPKKPSPTITKMNGTKGFATTVHWKYPRPITVNECKVLCSFPENWNLSGNRVDQWARLGNAVMPNQMKAIAETIKKEILCK